MRVNVLGGGDGTGERLFMVSLRSASWGLDVSQLYASVGVCMWCDACMCFCAPRPHSLSHHTFEKKKKKPTGLDD